MYVINIACGFKVHISRPLKFALSIYVDKAFVSRNQFSLIHIYLSVFPISFLNYDLDFSFIADMLSRFFYFQLLGYAIRQELKES